MRRKHKNELFDSNGEFYLIQRNFIGFIESLSLSKHNKIDCLIQIYFNERVEFEIESYKVYLN